MIQQYDLRLTSIPQVSRAITTYQAKIGFVPGSVILDYGGGKYDFAIQFAKNMGCKLVVYDPYWRTSLYNKAAIDVFKKHPDYIVCANVLNVIKENEVVEDVVSKIHTLSKAGTIVIFCVFAGNGTGHGKQTKENSWQRNQKTDAYLPLIRRYFPNAIKKYDLIIARK